VVPASCSPPSFFDVPLLAGSEVGEGLPQRGSFGGVRLISKSFFSSPFDSLSETERESRKFRITKPHNDF
jgi:hypothetical protein